MGKKKPIYRVLKSDKGDLDILHIEESQPELFVYIIEQPYWQYNIIDELEQIQVFPKKLKYLKTNTILQLQSIDWDKQSIYYSILGVK